MNNLNKDSTALLKWIAARGLPQLAWATDLDLTLLDMQSDPNKADTPPGLAEACREINEKTDNGFFIITGRDMGYVDNQVFPGDFFPASTEYHNLVRYERGAKPQALNPVPNWKIIDNDLDLLTAANPGLVLRKKPFMRSLHYSKVPQGERDTVKRQLSKALAELIARLNAESGEQVKLTDGGLIFDMGGDDKGKALRDFIEHLAHRDQSAPPRIPLYFGDSPGDLPAAHMAHKLGGIFIAVGDNKEVRAIADFILKDTAECRALLIAASQLHPVTPIHTPRAPTPGQ